ncbi:MAG: fumarylacetoacetate hydrolase family protein [Gammaproteobacteria bacterium]|nr:fumarylacetoacetate hydrolase family protein [Gammaproteobacteria bacterium]
MKLLRFGPTGSEKPGIMHSDGTIRDLSSKISDIGPQSLSPSGLAQIAALDIGSLPTVDASTRLGPCVGDIGKIVCVGLNYSDHAAETGMAEPSEPILFMKANNAINGPNDAVMIPKDSEHTDWEVELGIVIGTRAKHVSEANALDHVAGFCVVNDVSERNYQLERGGQWVKGKSCDTFAPIGPWMVTRDEVADPQALDMWLDVNGKRFQNGNTATMIFGVKTLVSYISRFITLDPGDVIPTGTPPGVGSGQKPQVFLKAGDVMTLGISGLGEQRQECVPYAD